MASDLGRVRITNTLAQTLERFLQERGEKLNQVHDICDSEHVGLILRRAPSGRKSWHYGYTLGARRRRVKVGDFPALSVEGARRAATIPASEVAMGVDPADKRKAARANAKRERERTVGAFIDGFYRRWAEAHLRSHEATLAALKADFGNNTENGHKQGAGWWDRPMADITVALVEEWRVAEVEKGNVPATINRAWQRLRAVLGKAVSWKVIPGPAPRIPRLKTDRRGRVRFLSEPERVALFRALHEREQERRARRERMMAWLRARDRNELPPLPLFTDHLQPLTRVWLGTGLRHTEGLSLTWSDVDFENDLINVRGVTAKNFQSRAVPMVADVRQTLLLWRQQHPSWAPDQLVFTNRVGERIRRVTKAWTALMKRAGITNFRIHDTRHDYASRLAMADVELLTIARLLGHEDISMVLRYAHLSSRHLREAVQRLAASPPPVPVSTASDQSMLKHPGVEVVLPSAA
jgi:integrase